MLIEIIADITCPWCFIGLKRLKLALEKRPAYSPRFHWRPFLLNPELKDGVINRNEYLERVFGSESRIQQFHDAIDAAGQAVGINFNFQPADITPSSVNAHRLISFAEQHISPLKTAETLFNAYFIEGKNIGESGVLNEIADELALDTDKFSRFVRSDRGKQAVFDENARIHRLGVNGVPSFVFGKRNVISGAQEPKILLNMLDFIATTERLETYEEESAH